MARILLEDGFGVSSQSVYADKVRQFSSDELERLQGMLTRLARREPVQYVVGKASFDSLTLYVSQGVLVPRPETAELVAWAAEGITSGMRVLDVGTGSGCIALALKHRHPEAYVMGCDVSPKALRVAEGNASVTGEDVRFHSFDLLHDAWGAEPWQGGVWDVLVSNPPYVCRSEERDMQPEVVAYEPREALFVDDADPLIFYRALLRLSRQALRPGGRMYVEINSRFGEEVETLFREDGMVDVELRKDMFDKDRMVGGTRS